jgi:hypothetical protein
VLISRLARVAVLSVGVFVSGCCQPDEAPSNGSDDTSPQKKLIREDPEPFGTGFKPLKATCTEPVVQLSAAGGEVRPDAGAVTESVREFVRANPEFASPTINYAEPNLDGNAVLARCPDSETANRLARKAKTHSRSMRAVPVCGFASSGWTSARRTLQLP